MRRLLGMEYAWSDWVDSIPALPSESNWLLEYFFERLFRIAPMQTSSVEDQLAALDWGAQVIEQAESANWSRLSLNNLKTMQAHMCILAGQREEGLLELMDLLNQSECGWRAWVSSAYQVSTLGSDEDFEQLVQSAMVRFTGRIQGRATFGFIDIFLSRNSNSAALNMARELIEQLSRYPANESRKIFKEYIPYFYAKLDVLEGRSEKAIEKVRAAQAIGTNSYAIGQGISGSIQLRQAAILAEAYARLGELEKAKSAYIDYLRYYKDGSPSLFKHYPISTQTGGTLARVWRLFKDQGITLDDGREFEKVLHSSPDDIQR